MSNGAVLEPTTEMRTCLVENTTLLNEIQREGAIAMGPLILPNSLIHTGALP